MCLAGLEMPKVHGHDKSLDLNCKPEHQKVKPTPRPIRQPIVKNTGATRPPIKPKSSAQQASHNLIEKSCKILLKPQRDSIPKTLVTVQPDIALDSMYKFDPLLALEELKTKREQWQPLTITHHPVISEKSLAPNDLGGQHDSLHYLNSPVDDALIELEYHKPKATYPSE